MGGAKPVNESSARALFPTTRWSVVVRAGDPGDPDTQAALATLCEAYWYPVYAMIRRLGHDEANALDLTQEYFARLLERCPMAVADPARGRFRAFLRTDCRHFLGDARDRDRARKRGGGGRPPLSIDVQDAEGRYLVEPVDTLTPERLFDRAWALALLARALDRLADDYASTGRAVIFEKLKGVLIGGSQGRPHAEVARDLGLSEGAAQKTASRLRGRYRDALRAEVANTLDEPTATDVEAEIGQLFKALGG